MKKQTFNYVLIICLIILTTWIMIRSNELSEIPKLMGQTNKFFLLLGILSMFGFWISDALIINTTTKALNIRNNLLNSLRLTMIGQYYSAITPFSTGGQPAQSYSMVNNSIPIGKATSVMVNKLLIRQISITLYSITMFTLKVSFIYGKIKNVFLFILFGIILNFIGLVIIVFLFLNSTVIKRIIFTVLNLCRKIKIIKNVSKYEVKLNRYLNEYKENIEKIRENKLMSIKIGIITIIQLTFYFSITYFVYRALGFNSASLIDIISIQSLLYMAVSFIPTPGNVGVSEGGFYILFGSFFTKNVLLYAIILWRIIIYYFNLLVSGTVTLIDFLVQSKKKSAIS
ncbi:lysylphosphatidylglycerol synthase transmembrane domain-containing protein [Thermohalobacter berrensis]|uniref:Phosphatidylglycerol lysyltransferase n=1 Tax=Thermohalobacter berrensis TaxID=99594 RepID=A0A419SWE2_9FIRM|nr:lysylphosphatidylglycerol synthase transmembrane domain-containing protein [Thermohalobacter berrensis]RKD29530.1 hypothetical protein BET03_05580 [Thermohalobacter berrensis]